MFTPPSDDELVARALEIYDRNASEYDRTLAELKKELRARILADPRIHLHDVRTRRKGRESLEAKLRIDPLRNVEDILGVRVITYFRDDVVWVEQIARNMLMVREGSYTNKADRLDDREFGYRSIQFVATIPPGGYGTGRGDDIRNMIWQPPLASTIVEIQIRSILEHAWAETEHDVYKQRGSNVPRSIRRRFALTAALIENADEQLEMLRDELALDRPDRDAEMEPLDGYVQRFVETERSSIALDNQIAAALDLPKRRPQKYEREVSRAVLVAGLRSSAALRLALEEYSRHALRMAIVCVDVEHPLILPDAHHNQEREHPEAFPGIGLYWLALGLMHKHEDPIHSFNSVSDARFAEYRDVGRYLLQHPEESALSVRRRYWAQAYPTGAAGLRKHDLNLDRNYPH